MKAAAVPASAARSFLAFDFGEKRIGVAFGTGFAAAPQPLRTLVATGDARFEAIAALLAEWQPEALVVGVPFHPDGAAHQNTDRARRFARQLHGRFGLPVFEVDERYTTTEALSAGARDADAAAACLILQQHLRRPVASAPDAPAP
jgi:putative holliday junction resolvase